MEENITVRVLALDDELAVSLKRRNKGRVEGDFDDGLVTAVGGRGVELDLDVVVSTRTGAVGGGVEEGALAVGGVLEGDAVLVEDTVAEGRGVGGRAISETRSNKDDVGETSERRTGRLNISADGSIVEFLSTQNVVVSLGANDVIDLDVDKDVAVELGAVGGRAADDLRSFNVDGGSLAAGVVAEEALEGVEAGAETFTSDGDALASRSAAERGAERVNARSKVETLGGDESLAPVRRRGTVFDNGSKDELKSGGDSKVDGLGDTLDVSVLVDGEKHRASVDETRDLRGLELAKVSNDLDDLITSVVETPEVSVRVGLRSRDGSKRSRELLDDGSPAVDVARESLVASVEDDGDVDVGVGVERVGPRSRGDDGVVVDDGVALSVDFSKENVDVSAELGVSKTSSGDGDGSSRAAAGARTEGALLGGDGVDAGSKVVGDGAEDASDFEARTELVSGELDALSLTRSVEMDPDVRVVSEEAVGAGDGRDVLTVVGRDGDDVVLREVDDGVGLVDAGRVVESRLVDETVQTETDLSVLGEVSVLLEALAVEGDRVTARKVAVEGGEVAADGTKVEGGEAGGVTGGALDGVLVAEDKVEGDGDVEVKETDGSHEGELSVRDDGGRDALDGDTIKGGLKVDGDSPDGTDGAVEEVASVDGDSGASDTGSTGGEERGSVDDGSKLDGASSKGARAGGVEDFRGDKVADELDGHVDLRDASGGGGGGAGDRVLAKVVEVGLEEEVFAEVDAVAEDGDGRVFVIVETKTAAEEGQGVLTTGMAAVDGGVCRARVDDGTVDEGRGNSNLGLNTSALEEDVEADDGAKGVGDVELRGDEKDGIILRVAGNVDCVDALHSLSGGVDDLDDRGGVDGRNVLEENRVIESLSNEGDDGASKDVSTRRIDLGELRAVVVRLLKVKVVAGVVLKVNVDERVGVELSGGHLALDGKVIHNLGRSAGTVVDGHNGGGKVAEAVSCNKESLTTLDVTKGRSELLKSGTKVKGVEEDREGLLVAVKVNLEGDDLGEGGELVLGDDRGLADDETVRDNDVDAGNPAVVPDAGDLAVGAEAAAKDAEHLGPCGLSNLWGVVVDGRNRRRASDVRDRQTDGGNL